MGLINNLLSSDRVHFFSLARYALIEALEISGMTKKDYVLVPEYICKEVVEIIELSGVNIFFYRVNDDLTPAKSSDQWPKAKTVLVVNYFGFPQNLLPFQEYSKRVGATIIEDNAHGFLSKDSNGKWLGMRTDIGIFSLRKTLCLSDGAAIVLNSDMYSFINPQLSPMGHGFIVFIKAKCKIKQIPFVGVFLWKSIVFTMKIYRKIMFNIGIDEADYKYKTKIAHIKNPNKNLFKDLRALFDKEKYEIERRRDLYCRILLMAKRNKLKPIFNRIPSNVVPYCFPFRATEDAAALLSKDISSLGLKLFKWPDLPQNITDSNKYKNIWIVNFL